MFLGRLARLADPIVEPVTADPPPGYGQQVERAARRARRSRHQVLADRRAARLR